MRIKKAKEVDLEDGREMLEIRGKVAKLAGECNLKTNPLVQGLKKPLLGIFGWPRRRARTCPSIINAIEDYLLELQGSGGTGEKSRSERSDQCQ